MSIDLISESFWSDEDVYLVRIDQSLKFLYKKHLSSTTKNPDIIQKVKNQWTLMRKKYHQYVDSHKLSNE